MNLGKEILQYRSESLAPEDLLDDLLGELKLRNYSVTRVNNIDNVFVSIGVVCLESDADLITLIKRADKRLAQAKISGRNKVCG